MILRVFVRNIIWYCYWIIILVYSDSNLFSSICSKLFKFICRHAEVYNILCLWYKRYCMLLCIIFLRKNITFTLMEWYPIFTKCFVLICLVVFWSLVMKGLVIFGRHSTLDKIKAGLCGILATLFGPMSSLQSTGNVLMQEMLQF